MKSFKEFTELEEALITFGGKAYPKFGQVVIQAGGSFIAKGAQYIKVKKQGQAIQIPEKELSSKIASYVPDTGSWEK